jgi:hypothetical protein
MLRTKYLSVVVAGFLAVLATGCIVDVEPDRATNPVGTEHTVTVTLRDPMDIDVEAICEQVEEVLEEEFEEVPILPFCIREVDTQAEDDAIGFFIVNGPNAGLSSVEGDGICTPSCAYLEEQISWTYRSNGQAGTDTIEACINPTIIFAPDSELSVQELTEEEFFEILVEIINDVVGTDYDSIEDAFCQSVTKTWVDRAPNIGAGLSGLFQGQPTALPTAPAPVATAPNQGIRPPNTGDGGLK